MFNKIKKLVAVGILGLAVMFGIIINEVNGGNLPAAQNNPNASIIVHDANDSYDPVAVAGVITNESAVYPPGPTVAGN